jgi:hypothetical protein
MKTMRIVSYRYHQRVVYTTLALALLINVIAIVTQYNRGCLSVWTLLQ